MNAPGKGLLKTVSILFIVFGAIVAVISVIGLLGIVAAFAMGGEVGAALGIVALVLVIYSLLLSIFDLVIGILGVKKADDPTKAQFFITTGIILCALSLISIIIGIANGNFQVTSLISFVLPILYIVGGNQNKKAV